MTGEERDQNMARELTVVVTGATGKQGGAVARSLLERGHKVRAVTRDPNSSRAKSHANAGATLVGASLEDTSAIAKALEGATSLFAMRFRSGGRELAVDNGHVPFVMAIAGGRRGLRFRRAETTRGSYLLSNPRRANAPLLGLRSWPEEIATP
jgi:NAD(P)-dependent dehydrogenase (short-subunit alcohol dehydrogenase family)